MAKVIRKKGEAYDRLKVAIKNLDNVEAKAGWFESAKYEDGTPVAYVAAIQEHGYAPGGIPPRPFMRPTVDENKGAWAAFAEEGSKRVLDGGADMMQVMEGLASAAVGSVQKTIGRVTEPSLDPKTVAARERRYASKGGDSPTKPLIDTGLMIRSMTTEVTKK